MFCVEKMLALFYCGVGRWVPPNYGLGIPVSIWVWAAIPQVEV